MKKPPVKPAMRAVAQASTVEEPPAPAPAAPKPDYPMQRVVLRIYPDIWRHVSTIALDERSSLQAIFLEGLQLALEARGQAFEPRWRFAPGILERSLEKQNPTNAELNQAARAALKRSGGNDRR